MSDKLVLSKIMSNLSSINVVEDGIKIVARVKMDACESKAPEIIMKRHRDRLDIYHEILKSFVFALEMCHSTIQIKSSNSRLTLRQISWPPRSRRVGVQHH